ncbi:hypothetical protein C2E23DRAFT_741129 [Lenzites betulinus]|nr:hypothetical protein C2E23DRAFT_741129 [Lenzites betulinus]
MQVPPAPRLPAAAISSIFVYPDSTRQLDPSNIYSDARRLEFMGTTMAEMMMVQRDLRTLMERAVAAYRWAYQVDGPFPPNVNPHSATEAHRIFLTYVGALNATGGEGHQLVKDWLTDLARALL